MSFAFADAAFPIRADIAQAYRDYWSKVARPGSWWTGGQRVAIAQASRDALNCTFCQQRKMSLSPYNQSFNQGKQHTPCAGLSDAALDAIHRIVTDQTRITRAYVQENVDAGLSKEAYVELVGVVVCVFSIDEFHRGLGLALETLPRPVVGEITEYRPATLASDIGFVPTVPSEGAVGNEIDLWAQGGLAPNVVRALTLVPDGLRDWRALAGAQYLSFEGMQNLVKDDARSLNRMQMELVAGRVSSINECFY